MGEETQDHSKTLELETTNPQVPRATSNLPWDCCQSPKTLEKSSEDSRIKENLPSQAPESNNLSSTDHCLQSRRIPVDGNSEDFDLLEAHEAKSALASDSITSTDIVVWNRSQSSSSSALDESEDDCTPVKACSTTHFHDRCSNGRMSPYLSSAEWAHGGGQPYRSRWLSRCPCQGSCDCHWQFDWENCRSCRGQSDRCSPDGKQHSANTNFFEREREGEIESSRSPFDFTDRECKPSFALFEEPEPSPPVAAGLANLGNTCFLNSILQCFSHTVPLVQGLCLAKDLATCPGDSEDFCLLCAFRDHVKGALQSPGQILFPFSLANNLNNISSYFRRYQQEDAHEFLQCFLDKLDSSWPKHHKTAVGVPSKDVSLVKQVFGGRLVSQLRCCNCGHISNTCEPLIDLSLEIDHVNNLSSALESFTKVEKIDDTEVKFTCEGCKQQVLVEKQLKLDEAPSVAAFHLKRFKSDGIIVEKIDKDVEYPLELDLEPFTKSAGSRNVQLEYELYAVVVHIGLSSTSGHYFCFIRSAPGFWYRFDDSKVARVSEKYALSQEAYILFYARKGTPWPSSLLETSKRWLELQNVLNTSPKSVLDNSVHIHNRNPEVANLYLSKVGERQDDNEESSRSSGGHKPGGAEMNKPKVDGACDSAGVNKSNDETMKYSEDTSALVSGEVNAHGAGNKNEKTCASSLREENACGTLNSTQKICGPCPSEENIHDNEIYEIENTAVIQLSTPSRSPSPDVYEECPDAAYQIPRNHLKRDNRRSSQRSVNKATHEQRKLALRNTKTMPSYRRSCFLAAMERDGSPINKRKRNASLLGDRSIPVRARRKLPAGEASG
ncbi:hypothetical protein Ancab_015741 [Ancistrocladus abbreviatus]